MLHGLYNLIILLLLKININFNLFFIFHIYYYYCQIKFKYIYKVTMISLFNRLSGIPATKAFLSWMIASSP